MGGDPSSPNHGDPIKGGGASETPDTMTSNRTSWYTNSGSYRTPVHRIDGPDSGPTAYVIGGQHGIEPSGWLAAERLVEMTPENGRLYVLPRADPTAIEDSTYGGRGGNMNDQWGTGGKPANARTANIWNEIQAVNPDAVFDLHSSQGIYSDGTGVGQAIFPTPNARSIAQKVIRRLNDEIFDEQDWNSKYHYTIGNNQSGNNNRLSHKVGGDLPNAKGFLCEPTRNDTSLGERIRWNLLCVVWALEEIGLTFEEDVDPLSG